MRPFFDIHCHLMTFDEPDFILLLKQVSDNIGKEAFVTMMSPDYMLDFRNKHLPTKMGNLINVMLHSQAEMAKILEDDLKGVYLPDGEEPFLKDGTFTFANQEYDKYVICPLVMDFTSRKALDDVYYKSRSSRDAFTYADKMLQSIRTFYQSNDETILEVLPFAGITPPAYTLEEVERWLNHYFGEYTPDEAYQDKECPHFFGIKLYPPMGFDPMPEDALEREKVEMIYAFAEQKRIPITTHCDDGGYRTTDIETSHGNTTPEAWGSVLEKFPKLILNFAHFGRQYQRNHFMRKQDKWRNDIIDLIVKYDHVYTDISFNGVSAEYYDNMLEKLKELKGAELRRLDERIMFGTDFMINLSKVESYHKYLKLFEESPLPVEEKLAYATSNCRSFLFEKN